MANEGDDIRWTKCLQANRVLPVTPYQELARCHRIALDRDRRDALIALKVPREIIGNAVYRRGEHRGSGADALLAQEAHQHVQRLSFLASRVGESRSASIPVALVPRDVIVGQ